jgi:hypothetical protein
MKTLNPNNFKYRVNYTAQCFLKDIKSRAFDNCFEMNDGDAVVVALMRRAFKNYNLKRAISKNWRELGSLGFPVDWEKVYIKYADIENLDELAEKLRGLQGKTE